MSRVRNQRGGGGAGRAGLPLFTGCEIQGLFQDFPGPFQANPGPSLSKLECFTPFFLNQYDNTHTVLTSFIIQRFNLIFPPIMVEKQKRTLSLSTVQHHL